MGRRFDPDDYGSDPVKERLIVGLIIAVILTVLFLIEKLL